MFDVVRSPRRLRPAGTGPRLARRQVLGLGAAAAATGLLAACERGGGAQGKALSVAVVGKGYADPFWNNVRQGALDAGKELGVEVTYNGPDNQTDTPRQTDQPQQALVRHPGALCLAALDATAQEAVVSQFAEAGIPVVAFDSGVPGPDVPVTTVATDNYGAAGVAAEHLSELVGGKGQVAIVCQSQTADSAKQREAGFRDWIEANAPGIEIVDSQYNNADSAIAMQQTSGMLQAHPDLVGIFATDDNGSVGAGQAVRSAGVTDLVLVGFDSGASQLELIRSGIIAGSMTQNPYKEGYDAVARAVDAIKGNTLKEFYDSGSYWYDLNNMDDPKIASMLYE